MTFDAAPALNVYAGYNEGSRAPSAIELGCADPANPCKLPNAIAGDPPLKQVVTKTFEAGVRGEPTASFAWNAGVFRADNSDDILFVADNPSGFGYFKNFGKTRRQGVEAGLSARVGSLGDRRELHLSRRDLSQPRGRSTARATAPTTRPLAAFRASTAPSRSARQPHPADPAPDVQGVRRLRHRADVVARRST